jgi:thiosulfate dehydrogenase
MRILKPYRLVLLVVAGMIITVVIIIGFSYKQKHLLTSSFKASATKESFEWVPPDLNKLPKSEYAELVRYGKNLIANTSFYLGPNGKVAALSNGMNCQNCHLDAGTKQWGNNYSAVFSTYPKFRERSGTVENIYKRVNDCIERSLNGKRVLDTNSHEMQAIKAYIEWLGKNVPKNLKPPGSGIKDLAFPDRAADPAKGRAVYQQSCARCHGANGEGLLNVDSSSYTYPPLWGKNSYTSAAGLFRLSRFAGYVKYNMPFDAPAKANPLTEEQAWDVAAFVNSQPRPQKKFKKDWPDITGKPVDYPFGPYADPFSEMQHKYGPFEPIRLAKEKTKKEKKA